MSLNVAGNQRVYTVPEIDTLLSRMTGFTVVSKLPDIETANPLFVHYKKAGFNIKDISGYANPNDASDIIDEEDAEHTQPVFTERPALVPYVIGTDAHNNKVWYTTGSCIKKEPLTDAEITDIWNNTTA